MRQLPTMEHSAGLGQRAAQGARLPRRDTVKAVIWEGEQLLLLHSLRWNGYKFAGGGVKRAESHADALARELREELGAELLHLGPALFTVTELSWAQETEAEVFRMDSFYYACRVKPGQHSPVLDPYEADLGLTPCLVTPAQAAEASAAAQVKAGSPRWLRREGAVLRALEGQA